MPKSLANLAARQSSGPQLVKATGKAVNDSALVDARAMNARARKGCCRVHTVPSTLTPQMRAEIAAAVTFGRSIPQTAKEYNCDRCVVTEIWARAEISKLRAMVEGLMLRRAA